MSSKKLRSRIYKAMAAYALIAGYIAFAVFFAPNKISDPGAGIAETFRSVNERGSIYDRNMVKLAYSDEETRLRKYGDNAAYYQPLLGYYSVKSGRISGLENTFDDLLTYSSRSVARGNDLVLTLDDGIMQAAAQAMNRKVEGACVVLNASNGEILGLLSSPSYNPATIDENYAELQSTNAFVNKATSPLIPGSVMKIISSAAIIHAGLESETFDDDGSFTVDSFTVVNHEKASYGEVALTKGIGYSVNTYFAAMSQQVGADAYEKELKAFLIGEDVKLDFATLRSTYNVDTKLDLAVTAYGQGETAITPLQIAMATASVANGGPIYRPHILLKTLDPQGKVTGPEKADILATPLSKEDAQIIASGMKISASRSGFADSLDVYSKTGTAETGKSGLANLWMTAYMEHNGQMYVVTMVQLNQEGTGSTLRKSVQSIFEYIDSRD